MRAGWLVAGFRIGIGDVWCSRRIRVGIRWFLFRYNPRVVWFDGHLGALGGAGLCSGLFRCDFAKGKFASYAR